MRNIFKACSVLIISTFILSITLFLCSCGMLEKEPDNNYKTIPDLIRYFEKQGIKMQEIEPIKRSVAHADDAVSILINGKGIGIYKYNVKFGKEKKKLKRVKEEGFIYLVGIKKPIVANGTFIMVGQDTHPDEKQLIKVFKSFK